MRRILIAILSMVLPAGFLLSQQPGRTDAASNGRSERKVGHSYADETKPLYVGDSTYIYLRGNVIIYHDGAVITCDSAVRYGDNRIDCFDRVVINQNATYIYGDRAEYDRDRNMARVYAPIIKVVDGDATLYTRNFTFDLLTNVGRYFGGGTMKQADNYMESREGYYYADSSYMIGVGAVEMRNPDYQLRSDSVVYNMNTEVASFWTKTYIWNSKGEILSANRGAYHNRTQDYMFRSHAYILTKEQEIWSDSMDYNTASENAKMYGNIQMRDDENGVMAFGDYGQYWGQPQNGLLTRNPSVLWYDKEKSDTLYMRSDSMFLYTYPASLVLNRKKEGSSDRLPSGEELITPGSSRHRPPQDGGTDTLSNVAGTDSLSVALADSTLSPRELKKLRKEEERRLKQEERNKKIRARLEAREKKAEARRQKRAEREAQALARRNARRGIVVPAVDSTALAVDSLPPVVPPDTIKTVAADSVSAPAAPGDSLQRVFYAYHDVRIYRDDFQAVCDSLVGFSVDSTLHMYIDPVLWQGNNQITATEITIYVKDKQLDRAFFSEEPMMVAEVEVDDKYNQIKGRTMESLFRNNDIYRHNVDGNAQTLYYMVDDKTGDYMGFMSIESANSSFFIDSLGMERIVYRGQPKYTIYPMDLIPPAMKYLPGFGWHIERRPEKATVFDRRIRPSERKAYEGMKPPQFPITEDLLKQRDEYIRLGVMVERNDRLTPFTIGQIRQWFDPDYGREPEDEISRGGSNVIETPGPMDEAADSLPVDGTIPVDSLPAAEKVAPDSTAILDFVRPSSAVPDSLGLPDSLPLPESGPAVPFGDTLRVPAETVLTDGVDVRDSLPLPPPEVPDALTVEEPLDEGGIPGNTIIPQP